MPFLLPDPVSVPQTLRNAVGGHPLVAELLYRRGIRDAHTARAFLDPQAWQPSPPQALPDLSTAVDVLDAAIRDRARILVWGDFDVDGQTATALLVESLRRLGAQVSFYIPNRARESHGVHLASLERLSRQPGFDVLLTCDTGITAYQAVAFARQHGAQVIVSDHHELGERLPEAHAVINPRRLPAEHPLATLPGVGVAWQLARALLARHNQEADSALDLVALGIVADVAEQRGDTRYLLQRGLQVLRTTRRLGLQALAKTAGLNLERVTDEGIGFSLGPRLNALGRLDDANMAVELLTTSDPSRADYLALRLESLNARRRMLTDQVYQAAKAQLAHHPEWARAPVIVLGQPGWPGGVVGIVASRLVEEYGRPVLLFSLGEDGVARGSARSVEGIHITQAIAAQQAYLIKFGGHPMAAGCALPNEDLPAFREALAHSLKGRLPPQGLQPALRVDAQLPLANLTPELVTDIERLAPFGAGNPQPLFVAPGLQLDSIAPLGRERLHRRVYLRDAQGERHAVLWWRSRDAGPPPQHLDLAYRVRMNDYRGEQRVQITWVAAQAAGRPVVRLRSAPAPRRSLVDGRTWRDLPARLAVWQAEADTLVWAEGALLPEGQPRDALQAVQRLVVWSAPPSSAVLRLALERAAPQEVILVARDPGMDQPQAFLQRMAAAVKYALQQRGGQLPLERLAAVTAQSLETVFAGLAWLAAEGHIALERSQEDVYVVRRGDGVRRPADAALMARQIRLSLEEAAQYRRFVRQGRLQDVLGEA